MPVDFSFTGTAEYQPARVIVLKPQNDMDF